MDGNFFLLVEKLDFYLSIGQSNSEKKREEKKK